MIAIFLKNLNVGGTGKYDNDAMVIYLNPDQENPSVGRIINSDLKFMDHSLKLPGYEKLCHRALEFVDVKIEKLSSSYNQEVASIDLKDLYKMSKTPQPKDWVFENDDADTRNTRGTNNFFY